MTWFSNVQSVSIKAVALKQEYDKDVFATKENLISEPYSITKLELLLLPGGSKMLRRLCTDETLDKESLPILGDPEFCKVATELILGKHSSAIIEGRAFGIQTPTGSCSLRLAAEFCYTILKVTNFCYPNTMEIYPTILGNLGPVNLYQLEFWDNETRTLVGEKYIESLKRAPDKSVVFLDTSIYNRSDMVSIKNNWSKIVLIIKEKNMFPIFQCGFQGIGSGNLDTDASLVRYFVEEELELFCCQSFLGTFGTENNPGGNLVVVVRNPSVNAKIKSQMKQIIKGLYGEPNKLGCRTVTYILNNADMFNQYLHNVKLIARKIHHLKNELRGVLELNGTPGDWRFLTDQMGMFLFTGLNSHECHLMKTIHHIYIHPSGQINMCSITSENVEYVASAIDQVIRCSRKPHRNSSFCKAFPRD